MLRTIPLIAALPLLGGCTYMMDRGNDALDILEFGVEMPALHVGIQVTPLNTGFGFLAGADGYGHLSRYPRRQAPDRLLGQYRVDNIEVIAVGGRFVYRPDTHHKGGRAYVLFYGGFEDPRIEVAAGVGVSLRLALLLDQFADFVLGWTTLDIMRDDSDARTRTRAREEEANPAPHDPNLPEIDDPEDRFPDLEYE